MRIHVDENLLDLFADVYMGVCGNYFSDTFYLSVHY